MAICLLALLSLAVDEEVILVELLVVGPVIAAIGSSPRETALVALFAVLVALPMGLATDGFGSTEHLLSLAAVALVGILAVGIARLRQARELDAARLSVQYGVARVLAEADSLDARGAAAARGDRRSARLGPRPPLGGAPGRAAEVRWAAGARRASRRRTSTRRAGSSTPSDELACPARSGPAGGSPG